MNSVSNRKVLAISYLFPNARQPGYGIFVLSRLQALAQHCQVSVIAPVQWYPFIATLRRDLAYGDQPFQMQFGAIAAFFPRFFVIPKYLKWLDALSCWWAISRAMRSAKISLRRNVDVVEAHWTYPDIVGAYHVAKASGCKLIVTVRGHEALYQDEIGIRRHLVATYLRKADLVVSLSDELKERVIGLGVKADRATVILNGVDAEVFKYRDQAECRRILGISADAQVILSVGRLTAAKGHQHIIEAVRALSANRKIALFIIGGVNPEQDFSVELRRQIADHRMDNVQLIDNVAQADLALWYSAADIFCLATSREGCPNVILESLACGSPVVATQVGATDKLIRDGENGLLIDPRVLNNLHVVLDRALGTSWNRELISKNMNSWSWARCAHEMLEQYRRFDTHAETKA